MGEGYMNGMHVGEALASELKLSLSQLGIEKLLITTAAIFFQVTDPTFASQVILRLLSHITVIFLIYRRRAAYSIKI